MAFSWNTSYLSIRMELYFILHKRITYMVPNSSIIVFLNIVTWPIHSFWSLCIICFSNLFLKMPPSTLQQAISLQSLKPLKCFLQSFKPQMIEFIICSKDIPCESPTMDVIGKRISVTSATKCAWLPLAPPKPLELYFFQNHYSLILNHDQCYPNQPLAPFTSFPVPQCSTEKPSHHNLVLHFPLHCLVEQGYTSSSVYEGWKGMGLRTNNLFPSSDTFGTS